MKKKRTNYTTESLINELLRFKGEHGRIPTSKDFDNNPNYPSRRTYSNHFGSFSNAIKAAGFALNKNHTKEVLISELYRFIEEFGKVPHCNDIEIAKGYPNRYDYRKIFGSWNNALKAAGLKVRVSRYTQEELDQAFMSFVDNNGRPPKLHEFNDASRYPSFWCYQNRFGSWGKALLYYGFNPNGKNNGTWYMFNNGELCKSAYECDVSRWLRDNGISYLRNVPYKDFVNNYHGRKDCDYVIIYNGEWIFLEIAGLYTKRKKKSGLEKSYIERFNHKLEHLLPNFNFKVFYPDDFRNSTLDDLFSFLWDIPNKPWFENEPTYQGVVENNEVI